jgi:hypothetical protein
MPQESRIPDLVELKRRTIEPSNRNDFDALMSVFAADPVWESRLGTFEGNGRSHDSDDGDDRRWSGFARR